MRVIFFILFSISLLLSATITIIDESSKKPIKDATLICGDSVYRSDYNGTIDLSLQSSKCEQIVKAPGYEIYKSYDKKEKIELSPFDVKGVFVSFYGISSSKIMSKIDKLIEDGVINALVIEIKSDTGEIAYKNDIKLAEDIGANRITTIRDVKKLVQKYKNMGVYTVAKIATFKDHRLATKRREFAVKRGDGLFFDKQKVAWSDPFIEEVQEYNIEVARSVADAGFDEVMFDYVRFPDHNHLTYRDDSNVSSRVSTIETFLKKAKKAFEKRDTFISAAIFGYTAWSDDDTGIGQSIDTIGRYVDYLAPMLYPSGFSHGIPNHRKPLNYPYEIIYKSITESINRSGLDSRRFRPWIQAFKDYAFDKRYFGAYEVYRQIDGAEDSGCSGVYIWNARNRYTQLEIEEDAKIALQDRINHE